MNSDLFYVGSNAHLVLQDITLDGDKANYTGNSLVYVVGGTLTLKGGAVLRDNKAINGGAVRIASSGALVLDGGQIYGNSAVTDGGGVYVGSGTLTMNGGKVLNNAVGRYGSGVYAYSGTFTMSGGVIAGRGNSATSVVYSSTFVPEQSGNGVVIRCDAANNIYATPESASVQWAQQGGVDGISYSLGGNAGFVEMTKQATATVSVSAFEELKQQIANFNRSATTNTTITVNGDIAMPEGLTVSNKDYALTITGGSLTRSTSNALFTVEGSVLLTLKDITLDGDRANYSTNSKPLVLVDGGMLSVGSGTVLQNNVAEQGGGVQVWHDGIFIMEGGEISGCSTLGYGGGVYIDNGTFAMSGGEISGNTATTSGGVCVINGSFIMRDGEISGNTAKSSNYGGGGVYVDTKAAFTMNGGEISGNSAAVKNGGGVFVRGGVFTMADGKISGNTVSENGGGVCAVDGTFNMNGGEISGNVYDSGVGAIVGDGVYINNSKFMMNGGKISDNSAKYSGGGVYFASGEFIMNNGEISQNTTRIKLSNPSNGGGGGVYVASGTFTMNGGKISGNNSTNSGEGVYVAGGVFIMHAGGTIKDNYKTSGNTGNVYVTTDGKFEMNGGEITRTTATAGIGVYVGGGTFEMNGGKITGQTGSGVSLSGTMTMTGGEISGNSSAGAGAGVNVISGAFTMNGGTISGNTATGDGGGVRVGGTFTMTNGTISGNTAAGDGGGVRVGGTFTMTNGTISGNTATGGGGVYNSGTFTMDSGKISSNTAAGDGGGLFAAANKNVTMNGGEISFNTAGGNGGSVYIVSTLTGSFVKMNGGLIFGRGSDAGEKFIYPAAWTPLGTGTSVAIHWSGADGTAYEFMSRADIIMRGKPVPTASWDADANGQGGIYYPEEEGFIPLNVTVDKPALQADDFVSAAPTNARYDGQPHGVQAGTVIWAADLDGGAAGVTIGGEITVLYNGSPEVPVNAGSYVLTISTTGGSVYGAVTDFAYTVDESERTYVIEKATYGERFITRDLKADEAEGQSYEFLLDELLPDLVGDLGINAETVVSWAYSGDLGIIASFLLREDGSLLVNMGNDLAGKNSSETLTVTITGLQNYNDIEASITFNLSSKIDVSANMSFEDGAATFTGAPLTHETATISGDAQGSITYAYAIATGDSATGNEKLVDGKPVNAGCYIVTATYEDETSIGSAQATFTVNAKALTDNMIAPIEARTYTGSAQEPAVTVTDDALGTLAKDTDYEVRYSSHTNAGTASVTARGMGNYTGEATANFIINQATPIVIWPSGLTATYGDALGDVVLSEGDAGVFSWTAAETTSVGNAGTQTHGMTYTPADSNYETVTDTVSIAVAPKAIAIVPRAGQGKTYGAAEPEEQLYDCGPALIGEDTMGGELTRVAGENVGSYAFLLDGFEANGNYDLSLDETNSYTIARATSAITLAADPASGAKFGAGMVTLTATIAKAGAGDMPAGEVLFYSEGTLIGRADINASGMATLAVALPVGKQDLTADYAGNANYTDSYAIIEDYIVARGDQAAVAIENVPAGNSVIYGVGSFALGASGGSSGAAYAWRSSDEEVLAVDAESGVVTAVKAGSATIYLKRLGNADYEASAEVSVTITVEQKPVAIIGTTAKRKTYDGGQEAEWDNAGTVDSPVGDDMVSVVPGSAAFVSADAASGIAVVFTGFDLDGDDKANYRLVGQPENAAADINPLEITVTPKAGQGKVYGTPFTTALEYDYSPALIGEDSFDGELARADDENVGSYEISQNSLSLNGNYTISFTQGVTFDITQAIPNVTLAASPLSPQVRPVSIALAVDLPADATGTLTLWDDKTWLDEVTLSETSFAFKASAAQNDYAFTVVYSGDDNYVGVTSNTVAYVFTKGDQEAVTASDMQVAYGTDLTLVSGGGSGDGARSYKVINGGTGNGTIVDATFTPTKAGTVTIKVTKAADNDYDKKPRHLRLRSIPNRSPLARCLWTAKSMTAHPTRS